MVETSGLTGRLTSEDEAKVVASTVQRWAKSFPSQPIAEKERCVLAPMTAAMGSDDVLRVFHEWAGKAVEQLWRDVPAGSFLAKALNTASLKQGCKTVKGFM